MIIRYSILEEFATVDTLIAIEPINAIITRKLKIVEPKLILSAMIERKTPNQVD